MPLPMFDTLSVSRKLTAAGFDSKQADALVESLAHAMDDTVATKADVAELKADVAELKANQAGIEAGIIVMQGDLTRLSETAATKAEIVKLETKVETEVANLESKIETGFIRLESKIETDIVRLETKVGTEMAGLKVEMAGLMVEMAQGFEEVNKRVTRTVFGVAVMLSAVITLLRLLL